MSRIELLEKALQIAHQMIDDNSCLSDGTLKCFRDGGLTDQRIIAELAGEILEDANSYYDKAEYAEG